MKSFWINIFIMVCKNHYIASAQNYENSHVKLIWKGSESDLRSSSKQVFFNNIQCLTNILKKTMLLTNARFDRKAATARKLCLKLSANLSNNNNIMLRFWLPGKFTCSWTCTASTDGFRCYKLQTSHAALCKKIQN